MNRNTALAISTVFHPVFVNTLGLTVLLFFSPLLSLTIPNSIQFFYIGFVFVATGIIPMLIVLVLKYTGKIRSILLDNQEERNIPYLITATLYLLVYYFLTNAHAPALIRAYLLGCACIVVCVLIINHFEKISIHAASLGALTGIGCSIAPSAMLDLRFLLMVFFVVSGITLSARSFLNAHNFWQLISGWMLGFVVMLLIL